MTINPYQPPQSGVSSAHPGPLPVRATGVMTADDARRALAAATKTGTFSLKAVAVAIVLMFLFMAVMSRHHSVYRFELWASAIELPVILGILTLLFFMARRTFNAAWNAHPENHQPVTWTFSEDGLFVETATSKHLHYWTSFIYAKIPADTLILAKPGGTLFTCVPRKFFESDEDWAAVCNLLALKLPVRETGRR